MIEAGRVAAGALACLSVGACLPARTWHATSVDHTARVTVRQHRGRACVAVEHRFSRCDDAVNLTGMALAERGASVAYAARGGARWVIVHDGRPGSAWTGVGAPVLSPDGARLAYPATDGDGWRVVLDGRPGPAFDAILGSSMTFDRAGRRFAYAARRGDSTFVVVDGVPPRAFGGVGGLVFSDDGARIAYIASLGGRAMAVVDGAAGPVHDAVAGVAFSRSGRAVAYAARDGDGWWVHDGTSRVGPFDAVRELAFREVGGAERAVFVARAAGREAVVVDGEPHRWHDRITSLAVAPRGPRWGYVADGATVHLDGEPLATERAATELVLSGDGRRWAYLADEGGHIAVVHAGGRARFDLVVDGTLQFVDDGETWACLAGDRARRAMFVVVDGRRTTRRLDWREAVRFMQRADGDAAASLRAWVAAEARLALRDEAGR